MLKKKILIILPRYHTNYFHTINALIKDGYKVKLLVYNKSKIEDHSNLIPLKIKQSKFSKLLSRFFFKFNKMNRFYFPEYRKLEKIIINYKPNIVMIRSVNKFLLFMFFFLKLKNNFKLFVYMQASLNDLNKNNFIKKKLLEIFNKLLNVRYYSPVFEKKKINNNYFYLPLVSKINFFRKLPNNIFLNVGKFIEKKNHIFFIKGIEKLKNNNLKVKGIIIGEVSNKFHKKKYLQIANYINKRKLSNVIKIFINIKPKNMTKYFKKSQYYVHTAINDPAPISIIEALAHNCKVICTHSCGTKNYINTKLNGKIIADNQIINLDFYMKLFLKRFRNDNSKTKKNLEYVNKNISYKAFIKYFNLMIKN
jgi:glycosyltransferase involved in cell wall biosynthesis